MNDLLELIRKERERQDEKWGTQDVPDPVMYVVLGEEVGEVGKAIFIFISRIAVRQDDIRLQS
jgi:hypothetical protein